ncbi:MAG: NAD-dependent epimerase/dehydratase family protein [Salibacteraceae bacterium]
MRILVTGGSGFIGGRLINELINLGHEILSIDKVAPSQDINHIVADISNPSILTLDYGKIDVIYHIAAQSGGYFSLGNPYEDAMWNSVGTMNVVKLAQHLKVQKLIYTSSMAVYGNTENAKEEMLPTPISFYGVSKLSGEYYTKLVFEHSGIPFTIFRLFATYGAGQDLNNTHQGILSIYLDMALKSNTIRITGKKNRVRELVHVSDVVRALQLGLADQSNNETYNVTCNQRLTPEIIINAIGKRLGKKLTIQEIDGYVGDQVLITGSNEKLSNLGWTPEYNLEKGINEFINSLEK